MTPLRTNWQVLVDEAPAIGGIVNETKESTSCDPPVTEICGIRVVPNCISGLSADMIWKKVGETGMGLRRARGAADTIAQVRAKNEATEKIPFMMFYIDRFVIVFDVNEMLLRK